MLLSEPAAVFVSESCTVQGDMAEVDLMSALIGLDMRSSCHISDRMVEAHFFSRGSEDSA